MAKEQQPEPAAPRICLMCAMPEDIKDPGLHFSGSFPEHVPVHVACGSRADEFLWRMASRSGGTCGDAADLAERTLRMVERVRPTSASMIEQIEFIVDRAGGGNARRWLAAVVPAFPFDDDEVPF